jgi:hypothetical protein
LNLAAIVRCFAGIATRRAKGAAEAAAASGTAGANNCDFPFIAILVKSDQTPVLTVVSNGLVGCFTTGKPRHARLSLFAPVAEGTSSQSQNPSLIKIVSLR